MSRCVTKIKHDVPHCTAEKGLQIFLDDTKKAYTGYCFSCAARGEEAYVKDPYKGHDPSTLPKGKTKSEIEEEVAEIRALGPPTKPYRDIPVEIYKRCRVRLAYSEYDGKTPFSLNYPMTLNGKGVSFKTKMINKKAMWSTGDSKGCDLFNWEIAKLSGAKRLYITEGEEDCLSLLYMLENSYKGKYAVTSIPSGASGAAQVIGRMAKEISSLFQEVVLVFDNDDAGYNAVREVQKVYPDILEAPHVSGIKDASEALQKGQQDTFVDFVKWKPRKPPMEGVVTVSQAMERGSKSPELGRSLPWPTLSEVMYGQRDGDCTAVAGAVGSGKTLICHEGAAHNMIEHNVPCFLALLEEKNIKTCWNIAAKIDSLPYNRPEVYKENYDQYMETIKSLEDKMYLWNSAGSSSYRFDLPEILSAIRFNYMEYDCKVAYVDNMTRIVDQMPTSEANEFINRYSSEIANLSAELNMHIVLFSHLNPPKGKDARSHEEGAEVFAGQLTGSRGIMRSFPNLIGFERNQHAEGDQQHNSFITSLKNRDHGEKRKIKTRYNPASGRMLEHNWEGDSLF